MTKGKRLGRLIVKDYVTDNPGRYCRCNCDCGAKSVLLRRDLVLFGFIRDCGRCRDGLRDKNLNSLMVYALRDQGMSYQRIANKVGITRQRAFQIVKASLPQHSKGVSA
jgi:hypothetical protein